jgi:ribose 1,5-bisphosphate isomerase
MTHHPSIEIVIERIRTDAIGGAADTAKEVVSALSDVIRDSEAASAQDLVEATEQAAISILRVMPSLAPPINVLHRILGHIEKTLDDQPEVIELKASLEDICDEILCWAETSIENVAKFGAEMIGEGDTVFTYSMSSTVWGILKEAKGQGKNFRVIVTESRPANEGLWTVREMENADIPVAVSIDACLGELVPKSDKVIVGADAVSSSGYCLCKVGTYPTALVAQAHGVPFYVAADTLKLDTSTLIGLPFRIDPISKEEVFADPLLKSIKIVGHIFDQTPPSLISAVITEKGVIHPTACVNLMWQMDISKRLNELLPDWVHGEL